MWLIAAVDQQNSMTSTILVFTLSDPVCTSNEMILPKLLVHPSITFTWTPVYKVPFETKKNVLGEKKKRPSTHTISLLFFPMFFKEPKCPASCSLAADDQSLSCRCLSLQWLHPPGVQAMKIMKTCPRFLYQGHHLEVWHITPQSLTHNLPPEKVTGPQ